MQKIKYKISYTKFRTPLKCGDFHPAYLQGNSYTTTTAKKI